MPAGSIPKGPNISIPSERAKIIPVVQFHTAQCFDQQVSDVCWTVVAAVEHSRALGIAEGRFSEPKIWQTQAPEDQASERKRT